MALRKYTRSVACYQNIKVFGQPWSEIAPNNEIDKEFKRWPDKRLPVHEEGASITCITSQVCRKNVDRHHYTNESLS